MWEILPEDERQQNVWSLGRVRVLRKMWHVGGEEMHRVVGRGWGYTIVRNVPRSKHSVKIQVVELGNYLIQSFIQSLM